MIRFGNFHNLCPTHLQHLFLISSSDRTWFALCKGRLLLMLSSQRIWSILHRQLFMNTCTFLTIALVALQVSSPYNRTVSTFVLQILTLVLSGSFFTFQMPDIVRSWALFSNLQSTLAIGGEIFQQSIIRNQFYSKETLMLVYMN